MTIILIDEVIIIKKLFATDLDGTLFGTNMTVSDNNCTFIKKLNALNCCFVIDTGRPYHEIEFLQHKYGIVVDYFITINGALIIDKQGNTIKHEFIPYETIHEIYSQMSTNAWEIYFSTGFESYKLTDENSSDASSNIYIRKIEQVKEIALSKIGLEYKGSDVSYLDEVCQRINSSFGNAVVAYRNVNMIDIAPIGCSKGSGIEYIMAVEHIDKKCTFAIGDSWNDEPMFNSVENSFTFRRVENSLKIKTKYLVDSVAECIENFVLD